MGVFGRKTGDSVKSTDLPDNDQVKEKAVFAQTTDLSAQAPTQSVFKVFKAAAYEMLMERIDLVAANQMTPEQLRREVEQFIFDFASEKNVQINAKEQRQIASTLVDDMIGLGPLEDIVHDDTVTDILVNGPNEVFVERNGKLQEINIKFHDEA